MLPPPFPHPLPPSSATLLPPLKRNGEPNLSSQPPPPPPPVAHLAAGVGGGREGTRLSSSCSCNESEKVSEPSVFCKCHLFLVEIYVLSTICQKRLSSFTIQIRLWQLYSKHVLEKNFATSKHQYTKEKFFLQKISYF